MSVHRPRYCWHPSIFENNDFDPTAVFKTEFVEKEAPNPLLNNAESPIATMLCCGYFFNASVPIAILLKPVETGVGLHVIPKQCFHLQDLIPLPVCCLHENVMAGCLYYQ